MNRAGQGTIAILVVVGAVAAVVVGQLAIPWSSIDGGGATSTGGAFTLTGTIGQPDATAAGAMTGGSYTLTGGFWGVALPVCTSFAPADFNQDCSVDDTDLGTFEACVTGPAVPYNPAVPPFGCTLAPDGSGHIAADFNGDGSVDQHDFSIFQRCYSGTSTPADPNCGK